MTPRLIALHALLLTFPAVGATGGTLSTAWYRGNTHAHTTRGDGDSAPEAVAQWYLDHGYHFLTLSEHNVFIDPAEVALPADRRKDFILIPGEEITGKKVVHTTALNIKGLVPWDFDHEQVSAIIQNHVDETEKAGGEAILNHPNFHYAVSAEDMLQVSNLAFFELYNGHPSVYNDGDGQRPSTETMWDHMLTEGKRIYAIASDDIHYLKTISPGHANPGRGWIMVRAGALEPDAIVQALLDGDYYCSTGVFLEICERGADRYDVAVDTARTEHETALPIAFGKDAGDAAPGYAIEFVGPGGEVLATHRDTRASFNVGEATGYVRPRVTFVRETDGGPKVFHAWGQPIFLAP